MRKKAIDALIEIGVPADLMGFQYICDAMEIYEEDETYITSKKIPLYERIGKMYGTSGSRVERAIRHAFAGAVTYGNLETLDRYMPPTQKPTNGNLLACLYLKLKTAG